MTTSGLGAADLQTDEYGDEQDGGDAEQGECVFDRPPGRMGKDLDVLVVVDDGGEALNLRKGDVCAAVLRFEGACGADAQPAARRDVGESMRSRTDVNGADAVGRIFEI